MLILKTCDIFIFYFLSMLKLTLLLIISCYLTPIMSITLVGDKNENIKEKPNREDAFILDDKMNINVNSERQSKLLGHKDCAEEIINKTVGKYILIEYDYYPGYFLYPRCIKRIIKFRNLTFLIWDICNSFQHI